MSVTYDITNDIGKVRLITGDNNIADAIFTDEEIQIFLDTGGSVNFASAMLLEAWASKYGANVDNESIGDYSYTQKIIGNMLSLAQRLRENESAEPAIDWGSFNLTDTEEEEEEE